jgi:hypothetical protein
MYRDLDGVDVGDNIVNEQQLCRLRRATRLEARDACQAIKGADLEFEPELWKAYHVVWRVLRVPTIHAIPRIFIVKLIKLSYQGLIKKKNIRAHTNVYAHHAHISIIISSFPSA